MENGSGKSTLINIILGLFERSSGEFIINDINSKYYNKSVSAVLQDFTKYNYSLRDNVAFGNIDLIDDVGINSVLDTVGLSNKVNELTSGVDTILSKEYTNGTELSNVNKYKK